jgi:hypothetical protein
MYIDDNDVVDAWMWIEPFVEKWKGKETVDN